MATFTRRNGYGKYSKLEKEDPEEKKHREAQFLIYKSMKQAEQIVMKKSSRPSNWLRLRISKLKVRIGKRFFKLRKAILSNISKTKLGVYKHLIMAHLRSLKGLFHDSRTVKYDSSAIANVVPIGCSLSRDI